MAFGLPELPAVGDVLGSLAGAALTALLQRTYFIQTQTQSGIPKPLLVVDVMTDEDPEYTADVTQHPVEEGPEVSDHIQLKNPTLKIKGLISNTPLDLSSSIGNIISGGITAITDPQARTNLLNTGLQSAAGVAGAALMGSIGGGSLLSSAAAAGADSLARTTLLALIQNRTPFDVVTKRQRFQNMVVQSLKMPRNKDTGYAVYFEIDLIQLRIVSPQFVNVQQLAEDIISSGSSNTNLGSQATNATSSQAQMSLGGSWYRQVYNGKSPNFFGGGG